MQKEKAGNTPAKEETSDKNYTDAAALPQGARLIEYLKAHGSLNAIEGRTKLGVMNVSQRIGELITKHQQPIKKSWAYVRDEVGIVHRVRSYIWCGENAAQADLFKGGAHA